MLRLITLPHTQFLMPTIVTSAALLGGSAWAHTGSAAHGNAHSHAFDAFFAGLAHPFTGLDHWVAMLAIGLWAALSVRDHHASQANLRSALFTPLAFAVLLLIGAVMGVAGWTTVLLEPMIAASVLVGGLLIASVRLPGVTSASLSLAPLLLACFAVFHGQAHGAELMHFTNPVMPLAGMLLATCMLHGVGLWAGWQLRSQPLWLSRTVGLLVTLMGAQMVWAAA
jgi:urease accessory protein